MIYISPVLQIRGYNLLPRYPIAGQGREGGGGGVDIPFDPLLSALLNAVQTVFIPLR